MSNTTNDKYKMFRNYMVNELGITREDIQEWTIQAVKETVERHIKCMKFEDRASSLAMSFIKDELAGWRRSDYLKDAIAKVFERDFRFDIIPKEHLTDGF